jgi:hypothetical protein
MKVVDELKQGLFECIGGIWVKWNPAGDRQSTVSLTVQPLKIP